MSRFGLFRNPASGSHPTEQVAGHAVGIDHVILSGAMMQIRRRTDKATEMKNLNVGETDTTSNTAPPPSYHIIRIAQTVKRNWLVFLFLFGGLFLYVSIQLAFEAKTVLGVKIGHEGAVEINKYIMLPGILRRTANWVGQTSTFLSLVRMWGGKESYKAWRHARDYQLSQRNTVLNNALKWRLHRAFEPVSGEVREGMSYYDVVAARASVFLQNLRAHKWKDFAVEKDKCAMYDVISKNGFPHCPILATWDNLEAFAKEGQVVRENKCLQEPFCFVKMCHITMGHLNSATRLAPRKPWEKVVKWAYHLWDKRPIDWDRTWGPYFDKLTATLKPRLMIQEGFKGGRKDNGNLDTPVELKVEVVWGRAYLAYITMGSHHCDIQNSMILRDGTIQAYRMDQMLKEQVDVCHQWIIKEGHIDVVWHLAEAFAETLQIDAVRVDIFITQNGDPRNAVINEISLSSGAGYAWHWEFLTQLWVDGYRAREKLRQSGKEPPRSTSVVGVETIDRGSEYYPVKLSRCNTSLISTELFKKHCK
ncbi:hypothetical protein AAMO2058_001156700 [Amorphochlora amoebiformis]